MTAWWKRPQFWLSIATCVVSTILPAMGIELGPVGEIFQVLGAGNAGRHVTQPAIAKKG
jgi:hypothetical protein